MDFLLQYANKEVTIVPWSCFSLFKLFTLIHRKHMY